MIQHFRFPEKRKQQVMKWLSLCMSFQLKHRRHAGEQLSGRVRCDFSIPFILLAPDNKTNRIWTGIHRNEFFRSCLGSKYFLIQSILSFGCLASGHFFQENIFHLQNKLQVLSKPLSTYDGSIKKLISIHLKFQRSSCVAFPEALKSSEFVSATQIM